MTHVFIWGNNPERASRKGQKCRLLAKGKKGSVGIEFEDGWRMCTSMRSIRKITERGLVSNVT